MSSKKILLVLIVALIAVKTTNGLLGTVVDLLFGSGGGTIKFTTPKVVKPCGAIKIEKDCYLKTSDGRFVALDATKQSAFITDSIRNATQFTVVEKGCNVYGICSGGNCLSRCEKCPSDTADVQTLTFNLNNSDKALSQWTLKSSEGNVGGPYYLKSDLNSHLTYKKTPNGDDQLILSTELSTASLFNFEDLTPPPFLRNGAQYYLTTSEGFATIDSSNPPIAFTNQTASDSATKFTAVHWGGDVYGFCSNGKCMSRCEKCASDTGDPETVSFHATNSNGNFSQWTLIRPLTSGPEGPFVVEASDVFLFLTTKKTTTGKFQLTLGTTVDNFSKIVFHEVL